MTTTEALQAVIENCPNYYAKQYAEAVPRSFQEFGQHGIKVQILYVLSNIIDIEEDETVSYWEDCELITQVVKTLDNFKEGTWEE